MNKVAARLTVVSIGTRDHAAMRAFYERLGWTVHATGDFARFDTAGATVALYPIELLAEEVNSPVPDQRGFGGMTLAINVEERYGVDATIDAARSAGANILAEPIDRDWGGRSAYFADPEGNVWEVAWVPGTSFDRLGSIGWNG